MNKLIRIATLLPLLAAGAAQAQNLVKNGDFETLKSPIDASVISTNANYILDTTGAGQRDRAILANWTNNAGVSFSYAAGAADDPTQHYYWYAVNNTDAAYDLWGPRSGSEWHA